MSNRKVKISLKEYERQVFPGRLEELNRVYDRVGATGFTLEKLGRTINGYEGKNRPTTEDGYVWFWGLYFQTKKGGIAILFPWAQDWDRHDGTQLDRSIGVYTRGEVDDEDIDGLVEKIYRGFLA